MTQRTWCALALLAGLSPAFAADAASVRYRCVRLTEHAGHETTATGVSTNGHIAGIQDLRGVSPQALGWYRQQLVEPMGMSRAFGVNDWGHVVGTADDGNGTASLWKDGVLSTLPALPGGPPYASPVAINNKGDIAGMSYVSENHWHAALWIDGAVIDLGTVGNNPALMSRAADINRDGDIVGTGATAVGSDDTEPIFWKRRSHKMTLLPKLTPTSGFASPSAINANGLIVGFGTYPGAPGYLHHALAWTTHDSVTDLGTLPWGKTAQASAVNGAGVIVGNSNVDDDVAATFATVWYAVGQAPVDLNTVLVGAGCRDSSGYRFILRSATGITDNGTIVANGDAERGSGSTAHHLAFRLVPREVR